ncbi:(2Fe-2S)-binding protein [uncultured Pseudokineococcus sp.]|uniref:(2Fe-2S)-binding protein n=1 Tax=uncultured Pseudokineococcus sp. TaxID=1642928 RepID=UPI00260EFFA6|nr:(2Fe-2S)-binding protein [uncultured Pseudokineococcus sp.]
MSPSPGAPDGAGAGSLAAALAAVAPLARERVVHVLDELPQGPSHGTGWVALADALAPGEVERWVAVADAGLAAMVRRGSPVPGQVAPTYVLGFVLDALAQAGGTPYALLRRVPDLDLARVAVRRAAPLGQPDAVALLAGGSWCLPGDRAAERAGARPAAGQDDLAAVLGRELVGAARAVERAWTPRVRVGSHQRWGLLADAVDGVLGALGAARGDVAAGAADSDRVLSRAPHPLRRPGRVRTCGSEGWTRARRSCCFAYAASPALLCRTCPRLPGR